MTSELQYINILVAVVELKNMPSKWLVVVIYLYFGGSSGIKTHTT